MSLLARCRLRFVLHLVSIVLNDAAASKAFEQGEWLLVAWWVSAYLFDDVVL